MKKGIEAFKRIKENTTCYVSRDYDMTNYDADVEVVEKELKALEIINKKNVDIVVLKHCINYIAYRQAVNKFGRTAELELTKEEFKIIREAFNYD